MHGHESVADSASHHGLRFSMLHALAICSETGSTQHEAKPRQRIAPMGVFYLGIETGTNHVLLVRNYLARPNFAVCRLLAQQNVLGVISASISRLP
ncbi:hypothetical protein JMJ77_0011344 [Colletotrichum scovillei]|uniref:Uncharacterized protein n=1 Tax=Colletotrichum scovillei TaxID=1209932 RepID=A0A9P7R1X4_9PEZI|nr:hypothetical protein JMJ77_0011344 [Colletotrichum scovillei]KAG7060324.1 hypothetical protein JMJ78_0015599 [Colletotrichum scovillei]KAG7067773.1 hypothetical protein JMJ76_0009201 [Colletotrichum scovillei]